MRCCVSFDLILAQLPHNFLLSSYHRWSTQTYGKRATITRLTLTYCQGATLYQIIIKLKMYHFLDSSNVVKNLGCSHLVGMPTCLHLFSKSENCFDHDSIWTFYLFTINLSVPIDFFLSQTPFDFKQWGWNGSYVKTLFAL